MRNPRIYAAFALVCAIFGTTFLAIRLGVDAGRALAALAPRAALLSLLYIVANFGATFGPSSTSPRARPPR